MIQRVRGDAEKRLRAGIDPAGAFNDLTVWRIRSTYRDGREGKRYTFLGRRVAKVDSRRAGVERWTELQIFRTHDERYIAAQIGRSIVEGETDYYNVSVSFSLEKLITHLGSGVLAMKAYTQMGVSSVET